MHSGPTRDKVLGLSLKKGVGIIGWVIENQKPSIVEDCSKDERFSSSVDQQIKFVTRSLICAPLVVKSEVFGSIQIINKKEVGTFFNNDDLELLMLFAASSAMYIKNARLFSAEKKANELSALIKVSKEITSTLDLDSVLMTIVNLSSRVIPYDRAAIAIESLSSVNTLEVRALTEHTTIDRDSEEIKTLRTLLNSVAEKKKDIEINSRDDYLKTEGINEQVKEYIGKRDLQSFWAFILKDDQGILGIISLESKNKNLIPETKKELTSILVSQSTVALRNASLYSTIPSSQILHGFWALLIKRLSEFKNLPRVKQLQLTAGALLTLISLVIIRVPMTIGANIEILPITTTFYSRSKGTVSLLNVREGQSVAAGELLVKLDIQDLLIELKQKESTRQRIVAEMIKLQTEDRIAEFKIKETERISIDHEIELLASEIAHAEVRSTFPGVIVGEKLDELVGKPVSFGQELIKLVHADKTYVQFQIAQDDVQEIAPGQKVKFKVFGHPNLSFSEGITLASVSGEGRSLSEHDPTKYFFAVAEVPIQSETDKVLRPGMTGRGKIYSGSQSLIYLFFGQPLRWIALKIFF